MEERHTTQHNYKNAKKTKKLHLIRPESEKKMKQQEEAPTEHALIQAQTGRGNRRTVKAGHYVVLAAITSKFIWAPEWKQKSQERREKREEVSSYQSCERHTCTAGVVTLPRNKNVSRTSCSPWSLKNTYLKEVPINALIKCL